MANERKLEILSLLNTGSWWTASEVAWQLGLSLSNASELLRRYYKNNLVARQRIRGPGAPPRAYIYGLTQKGGDRLEWLIDEQWDVKYE